MQKKRSTVGVFWLTPLHCSWHVFPLAFFQEAIPFQVSPHNFGWGKPPLGRCFAKDTSWVTSCCIVSVSSWSALSVEVSNQGYFFLGAVMLQQKQLRSFCFAIFYIFMFYLKAMLMVDSCWLHILRWRDQQWFAYGFCTVEWQVTLKRGCSARSHRLLLAALLAQVCRAKCQKQSVNLKSACDFFLAFRMAVNLFDLIQLAQVFQKKRRKHQKTHVGPFWYMFC